LIKKYVKQKERRGERKTNIGKKKEKKNKTKINDKTDKKTKMKKKHVKKL
jgi:hypothetical protein